MYYASENLHNYTLPKLRQIAKEEGIKNFSKKSKKELVYMLTTQLELKNYTKMSLIKMYDDIVPRYGLHPLHGTWDNKRKKDIILLLEPFLC